MTLNDALKHLFSNTVLTLHDNRKLRFQCVITERVLLISKNIFEELAYNCACWHK